VYFIIENDVIENMVHLTDDHLKELQISIGNRIIFKHKLKLYENEKEKKETEQNIQDMDGKLINLL